MREGKVGGALSAGAGTAKELLGTRFGIAGGNLSCCKLLDETDSDNPLLEGGGGGAPFTLDPDPALFLLGGGGGGVLPS